MNDDINGKLNDPRPLVLTARPRGYFMHSLGLTGELEPNYVSPRVALLRMSNDISRASEADMLYGLKRRGYIDKLVIEVDDFGVGERKVNQMLSEKTVPTHSNWTCFLTMEMGSGSSPRLVFAFKSQVDRLLFSMEWPRD